MEKARELQKNIYFCVIDYAKTFDCVDHNKLWKILKEMGIPDHLTCLLRNVYVSQEATVRTGHRTTDWFQIGKGVHQGCISSPYLHYQNGYNILVTSHVDKDMEPPASLTFWVGRENGTTALGKVLTDSDEDKYISNL